MKCKTCGNTKNFTMIEEIAFWNDKEKKFEPDLVGEGSEYYVCDVCMRKNKEGFIDTEGDY